MSFEFLRNRVSTISFLIFLAALLIYPAVERNVQVGLWHLYNGNRTRFLEYEIPVPVGWIASQTVGGTVSLLEVGTYRARDAVQPTIFISKITALSDMETASRLNEESLKAVGAEVFDRRTVDFDGEQADCIVSNELVSGIPVPSDSVITIKCQSTSGLNIISSGDKQNVATFFSVVSQIRKA